MDSFEVTLRDGRKILASTENGKSLRHGDLYVACRNTGWELLTCNKVEKEKCWVEPMEEAYFYDTHECHKVISMTKPKDPQEVYKFIIKTLRSKYGTNVRCGYLDGSLDNANKRGIGAGIAIDCENQPSGTDVYVNVGYFF